MIRLTGGLPFAAWRRREAGAQIAAGPGFRLAPERRKYPDTTLWGGSAYSIVQVCHGFNRIKRGAGNSLFRQQAVAQITQEPFFIRIMDN